MVLILHARIYGIPQPYYTFHHTVRRARKLLCAEHCREGGKKRTERSFAKYKSSSSSLFIKVQHCSIRISAIYAYNTSYRFYTHYTTTKLHFKGGRREVGHGPSDQKTRDVFIDLELFITLCTFMIL